MPKEGLNRMDQAKLKKLAEQDRGKITNSDIKKFAFQFN